eukprot:CAMPEP_0194326574 /NCGR_PEP_ID=MMETSP0171-20130528/37070_1 /TAXON_ID=218684 /ORGANISM="Corethron pennatum, Strain L29A3" /LENGTH=99 /DNA_ID=CAMNT_0039086205 /DNA_START=35 /DNA_END=331 /DNA_ORIENTATION=+
MVGPVETGLTGVEKENDDSLRWQHWLAYGQLEQFRCRGSSAAGHISTSPHSKWRSVLFPAPEPPTTRTPRGGGSSSSQSCIRPSISNRLSLPLELSLPA